jgi:hypothetical protein
MLPDLLMGDGVVAQDIGFQLHVIEPALDHVADRDDAAQGAVLDHGHMADAVRGHQPHDIADFGIGPAGADVARHERRDGEVDDRGAMLGEALDDVALGEDAFDALAAGDDDGADMLKAEPVGGGAHPGIRRDGDDLAALVVKNALDAHGTPRACPAEASLARLKCHFHSNGRGLAQRLVDHDARFRSIP